MDTVRKEKSKRKSKPVRRAWWPFVLLILAVGLAAARYVTGSSLPIYPLEYDGPVIYPILVALHSSSFLYVFILLILISFIGVGMEYQGIIPVLIGGGLTLFCCYITLWAFFSYGIQNWATTSYNGHVYYVLEYEHFRFEGSSYFYYLYQCDSMGIQCQILPDTSEVRNWSYHTYSSQGVAFHTGGITNALYLAVNGYIRVIDEKGITAESLMPLQGMQPITKENAGHLQYLTSWMKNGGLFAGIRPGTHQFIILQEREDEQSYALHIYDIDSLQEPPRIIESPQLQTDYYHHYKVLHSANGSRLAIAIDNEIHMWDLETWSFERLLMLNMGGDVRAMALNADGTRLYASYDEALFGEWDVTVGAFRTFEMPEMDWVMPYAVSPDGHSVFSKVEDGIASWNIETGTLERVIPSKDAITDMALSPDGALLYAIQNSYSGTLVGWHTEDWSVAVEPIDLDDRLTLGAWQNMFWLQFFSDDLLMIRGRYDLHLVDPISQQEYFYKDFDLVPSSYASDNGWFINSINVSSDNRYILTSHSNGVVQFWGVPDTTDQ